MKKLKSLFPLKDRSLRPSCKSYKGIYIHEETYIGQTIQIILLTINQNQTRPFLLAAPKHGRTRKILEAFFFAKLKPSLNKQGYSNIELWGTLF